MENPEVTRPMDSPEIVNIAIAPPAEVGEGLITAVAAIINKDLYTTRLLLSGKSPRIIAHFKTLDSAETAARALRNLSFRVIAIKDSELHQINAPMFRARVMKFNPGEFVFQNKDGAIRTMNPEDIFLIIKGVKQQYSEKEITISKTRLNLPATLLTGGIPIQKKVQEKSVETSILTEYYMRLYPWKSPEPEIEITQFNFDYSCLGAQMSAATLQNFNTLITTIRELCHQSVFDDSLVGTPKLGAYSTKEPDKEDVRCKLIYLFHEDASGRNNI